LKEKIEKILKQKIEKIFKKKMENVLKEKNCETKNPRKRKNIKIGEKVKLKKKI